MTASTRSGTVTGYSAYVGPYAAQINASARRYGFDPVLLGALLAHESAGFNADVVAGRAEPSAGDVGIAQIHLAAHPDVTRAQASSPAFAIDWAARYLAELKRTAGSVAGALRAYNTGTSAVTPAGTSYVDQVMAHYRDLLTASRGAPSSGYVNPLPGGATWHRLDQGVDLQGHPGDPVVAIGRARIDAVKSDPGGFGAVVYYTLLNGPWSGRQVYVGHAQPVAAAGTTVDAGAPVARLLQNPLGNATAPGWTEIGLAANSAPAGPSTAPVFASFLHSIWGSVSGVPGSVEHGAGSAVHAVTGLPGDVVGATADALYRGIVKPTETFFFDAILYAVFLVGGAVLVIVGLLRLFAPAREHASAPLSSDTLAVFAQPAGAEAAELAPLAAAL